ncbi:MAG: alpha/beta hydrolase [Chloroflexota bacterium]
MAQRHPHAEQALATDGELLTNAEAAVIIIHGRGGTNHQALSLIDHVGVEGVAYLAPQAADYTWYPHRFLVPRAHNEPHLSSALQVIDSLVSEIVTNGIATHKIVLMGFSQGACLAAEYVARNPKRFGGLIVFSGGLIGTDEELTGYSGSLDQTPVFIGCSDVDFHIPVERVHQTAEIFGQLEAEVEARIYPGMGHTINQDELDYARDILRRVVQN